MALRPREHVCVAIRRSSSFHWGSPDMSPNNTADAHPLSRFGAPRVARLVLASRETQPKEAIAMPVSQSDKAARFRKLHEGPSAFIIPNPWDAGSARLLAGLGFEALATSSGAEAGVLGRRDGSVTREEALAHARAIVEATDLPVSADLEKGFGDAPEAAAETIRRAAEIGLVGGSIEDASGNPQKPLYEIGHAAERVATAVAAARKLAFPFTLTARAENHIRGNPDLEDTIKRLQAYEKAGADVLMAPGLPDLDAVRKVCSSIKKPFNFMIGIKGRSFPVADLAAAGVRRISLATSLYRAAMTGLLSAAREAKERGTFGYIDGIMATPELNAFMKG
jgi:2-methylisocitrate lyase-like PEP mutase family enzyme